MINNTEAVIDILKIHTFRNETVAPGVVKYIEQRENDEVDVKNDSKIALNISGRYDTGEHAKGQLKYNPTQVTNYNLGSGKKQILSPLEIKIVLTMKRNEIAWVKLEPGQHTYQINKPIYFRYHIKSAEDPNISFSNLTIEEKYKMIKRRKDEGDFEFSVAKNYQSAKKIYISCFGMFNQVSKKEKEAFTPEQIDQHRVIGCKILGNLLSTIYLTKTYIEAKDFMKGAYNFLDAKSNYTLVYKYYEIAKKIGDKNILKEVLKQLLVFESDENKRAKYIKEVDDIFYDNTRMNKAFMKALREADQEENREKTFRKVKDSINITFDNEARDDVANEQVDIEGVEDN